VEIPIVDEYISPHRFPLNPEMPREPICGFWMIFVGKIIQRNASYHPKKNGVIL
jgi:hypothetical protein